MVVVVVVVVVGFSNVFIEVGWIGIALDFGIGEEGDKVGVGPTFGHGL